MLLLPTMVMMMMMVMMMIAVMSTVNSDMQGKYVNDNGSRSPDDGTGKIPPAMMMAMGHHDSEGARPSLTDYVCCHYCWTSCCLWLVVLICADGANDDEQHCGL